MAIPKSLLTSCTATLVVEVHIAFSTVHSHYYACYLSKLQIQRCIGYLYNTVKFNLLGITWWFGIPCMCRVSGASLRYQHCMCSLCDHTVNQLNMTAQQRMPCYQPRQVDVTSCSRFKRPCIKLQWLLTQPALHYSFFFFEAPR
jgi:hypothetical protein